MSNDQLEKNYQKFSDRKILKDLPFYRRHPRTFITVGSTIGVLILFSKPLYDIFKPNSTEDLQKKLYLEKLKQLKLQEELEYVLILFTTKHKLCKTTNNFFSYENGIIILLTVDTILSIFLENLNNTLTAEKLTIDFVCFAAVNFSIVK